MAEIHLLAVDVGHSRVKLGAFEAGELVETWRVDADAPDNLEGALEQARERLEGFDSDVVVAASNSALVDDVTHMARMAGWDGVALVGRDVRLPIDVHTLEPDKTGVDRILNVAAAFEQLGKACVVVDAGTALTVDFCDARGAFLGGAIAPGATLQADALARAAPHLPLVKPVADGHAFGRDTLTAINSGIVLGLRGLVRECVESHAMTQNAWPEVVATGGDAFALFGGEHPFELIHAISRDLTLYGIALAYAHHHSKAAPRRRT